MDSLAKTVNFEFANKYDIVYSGYLLQEIPTPECNLIALNLSETCYNRNFMGISKRRRVYDSNRTRNPKRI